MSAFKKAFIETCRQSFLPNAMTDSEALKILNLSESFKKEELDLQFKKFYTANSKENKGSPYIQSKIKEAHEYLIERTKKN